MARLLAQERETIIRYDGTGEPAVVGSNIPGDVAKLAKLWGPAPDIRGEWHSWKVPKRQVRLPRPARQTASLGPTEKAARGAALKRWRESRKQAGKPHNRSKT